MAWIDTVLHTYHHICHANITSVTPLVVSVVVVVVVVVIVYWQNIVQYTYHSFTSEDWYATLGVKSMKRVTCASSDIQ